jgi:hypothetical protein
MRAAAKTVLQMKKLKNYSIFISTIHYSIFERAMLMPNSEIINSLAQLHSIIETDQSPNQPIYKTTWQFLHQTIKPWPKIGPYGGVIAWPLYISDDFISLVQSGDWFARILFLHHSVAMRLMCNRWYVHDWGRRAVLAMLEPLDEIPPRWTEMISWIKQAVEIDS